MGDDINDLPVMAAVGALRGPRGRRRSKCDGRPSWSSRRAGGRGCLREFIEAILRARGDWERAGGRLRRSDCPARMTGSLTDTALLAVVVAAAARAPGGDAPTRTRRRRRPARPPAASAPPPTTVRACTTSPPGRLELAISELGQGRARGPGRGGGGAGPVPPAARGGPGGARDPAPPGRCSRARPHPGRTRSRPRQPGHRLPQGRVPRPGAQDLRRGPRGRSRQPACAHGPTEALRGPAAVGSRPTRCRLAWRACARPTTASSSAISRPRSARGAARAGREAAETAFKTALCPGPPRGARPSGVSPTSSWSASRDGPPRSSRMDRVAPGTSLPCLRPSRAGVLRLRGARALRGPSASGSSARTRAIGEPAWPSRATCAKEGKPEEAPGLLLRAVEANPQALLAHLELLRTLKALGPGRRCRRYLAAAEESAVLRRPPPVHRVPVPRRRHALALPALPRVEHVRGGAGGTGGGVRLIGESDEFQAARSVLASARAEGSTRLASK